MPLSSFHPIIQEWFRSRFDAPTDAQAAGWPAIARGRHTLISAPTGSGKTLAAFLTCIDGLVRSSIKEGLPDITQVVYVSPLKALSNDIQKNLASPLEEISALAEAAGTPFPEIRAAVRTGDTKPSERQRMAKKPPHILITTPESLYILLTSRSGRAGLRGVHTLILDEIHAVADDKRGSHLTLSVERLCALADRPVTRIGLSATQRPIEETARFLVGSDNISSDGTPDCLVVDSGHSRSLDLNIHMPQIELGPIATHELWAESLDTIAGLATEHGTTLVFVNTRRLVERVAHQLSERLGEEAVVAHHGSLSRAIRLEAEQKLKNGQVKVCVATASLELGIDIGVVELVCQIGSPRSIGLLLQRVGRSGHTVGGTPKGRLFPLTRDELVECSALMMAVRRGKLDTLGIPAWPLDVLAQQIVASCAAEDWSEDSLFELCQRAYPYRDLPRLKFDQVIQALATGYATRLGSRGAFLHRDSINHRVKARRGAGIAAMTSGGAIPDNADYDVIAEPDETFVGTVNEDFAIESMAGDVFLLGNTPWKIRRVESGRVRVEDAQGLSPTVPFWLGEAPGRTWELSEEITKVRQGVDNRLDQAHLAEEWLTAEAGLEIEASRQVVAYMEEGKRILGTVPTGRRVVAERFFDESGGMQLVIHAPFGARINRAWGMALRKQICRSFDFELQAASTDDGLNFSLGPNLSFPIGDVFTYLSSRTVEQVLRQALLQAPVFTTRWRWNATRALAVLRHTGGRKVPAPLQRMRSDDLLAAVFPAQAQCRDNAFQGDVELPDHPLTFETMRDCLTEAADLEGLRRVLESIESGDIEVFARDTVQPSVFSHQLLNAMPYAFLDDAPLEERRARAVSLRRALPDDARDLGSLDLAAIEEEGQNAWPRVRDLDELHDALLVLGVLPVQEVLNGNHDLPADAAVSWFDGLVKAGRAHLIHTGDAHPSWVAAEKLKEAMAVFPDCAVEPPVPEGNGSNAPITREDAVLALVRGWAECSGPFSSAALARTLSLDQSDVDYALAQLENEGLVLRGRYTPGATEEEYCDRRILARIHRTTIGRLRREVEPVSPAVYLRFLFQWQHVEPAARLQGEAGLLDVIELLQGFEAAAGSIESELLAARISDYKPSLLDRLSLGGEVVWGRFSHRKDNGHTSHGRGTFSRMTPVSLALRESLEWLQDQQHDDDLELSGASGEIVDVLSQRGASFLSEIMASTRRLSSDVEEALWQLALSGRVTTDSVEPLRALMNGKPDRGRRAARLRRTGRQRRINSFSRWSLLQAVSSESPAGEARAWQLLRRYGVLFPELLVRETLAPRWRELVQLLRRMEARGEIRGGRFISGFVGEQFAMPEAVEALRRIRNQEPAGQPIVVSACDPLNLVGILTPGERVPAVLGNKAVFQDGVPMCSLENGNLVNRVRADDSLLAGARSLLDLPLVSGGISPGPAELPAAD